jgi:hypothetical protein
MTSDFNFGIEYFTGTAVQVYAETIYGANLKNKLERDVLTISQQTLTASQKAQVLDNLGINASTLRDVPIAVGVSDWELVGTVYQAEFTSAYITTTSKDLVFFDRSYKTNALRDIFINKKTGGGGLILETSKVPSGTITGTVYTIDANDGKVPILIENTVTPIANGGTGQNTLAGAKQALGITDLAEQITTLNSKLTGFGDAQTFTVDGVSFTVRKNQLGFALINASQSIGDATQDKTFVNVLPSGYRPIAATTLACAVYSTDAPRIAVLSTNGNITLRKSPTAGNGFSLACMYACEQ